jgi:hypothetical protein
VYGAKTQYATKDETPPLTSKQCLTIQKVTGSVLYYARAVDPTVLMPLNYIATEQTKVTEKTQAVTNQLLDFEVRRDIGNSKNYTIPDCDSMPTFSVQVCYMTDMKSGATICYELVKESDN